jgi:hypothetical protein
MSIKRLAIVKEELKRDDPYEVHSDSVACMLKKRPSKKGPSKKRRAPTQKAKTIHFERIPLEVVKTVAQVDMPDPLRARED